MQKPLGPNDVLKYLEQFLQESEIDEFQRISTLLDALADTSDSEPEE